MDIIDFTDKATVLVVDDTPDNLTLMSGLLKDSYKVKVANNGEMALNIAAADHPPDLILLDIIMPGMDGYEVCQRLKADPKTRDIPVIFLTAKAELEDEKKGLELGAVDYIIKPISPPIVLARIKAYLTLKTAADSLREEKIKELRRLATVVSDSNDAIILHDFDGKILAWNRGAKETYGYTEVEMLGKNVREIVAEADREAALTLIQRIKQGDIVKSFELRRVAKDGRILDVWLTTTLLTDEAGKPVAIATTERNITERKRDEEEIKQLNVELEQHVLQRTAELEAANPMWWMFVCGCSATRGSSFCRCGFTMQISNDLPSVFCWASQMASCPIRSLHPVGVRTIT